MPILSLTLENFRNLKKFTFSPDPNCNIFLGTNAQGKTNLLEALVLLNFGKSLWAEQEINLLQHQQTYFRVLATISQKNGTTLELSLTANKQTNFQKKWFVNGVAKNAQEFLGHLPLSYFRPADLNLIILGKAQRRRYLNLILCQTQQSYLTNLIHYNHALKNRNALLNQIAASRANLNELTFWEETLAQTGSAILQARTEFLQALSPTLTTIFQTLTQQKQQLQLKLSGEPLVSAKEFLAHLAQNRAQDLRLSQTSFGPHRQDLTFYLAAKNLATTGSRGEIRSAVLALKLAELAYLRTSCQEQPILLLDDVFSELDRQRQKRLSQLVTGYQSFWTTTKPEHVALVTGPKKIWQMRAGAIDSNCSLTKV